MKARTALISGVLFVGSVVALSAPQASAQEGPSRPSRPSEPQAPVDPRNECSAGTPMTGITVEGRQVTVCCNNNNGYQICIGDFDFESPLDIPIDLDVAVEVS